MISTSLLIAQLTQKGWKHTTCIQSHLKRSSQKLHPVLANHAQLKMGRTWRMNSLDLDLSGHWKQIPVPLHHGIQVQAGGKLQWPWCCDEGCIFTLSHRAIHDLSSNILIITTCVTTIQEKEQDAKTGINTNIHKVETILRGRCNVSRLT